MKKILLSILCMSLYACQESKPEGEEITQEEVEKQDKLPKNHKKLAAFGD